MNPMQMLQNFITRGLSPQKIVEQIEEGIKNVKKIRRLFIRI